MNQDPTKLASNRAWRRRQGLQRRVAVLIRRDPDAAEKIIFGWEATVKATEALDELSS